MGQRREGLAAPGVTVELLAGISRLLCTGLGRRCRQAALGTVLMERGLPVIIPLAWRASGSSFQQTLCACCVPGRAGSWAPPQGRLAYLGLREQ